MRRELKARAITFTVALCFAPGTLCFASDANIGTWKLNEAKSKFAAGSSKNVTAVYDAVGDSVKATDGTDGAGKPTHNEWTGKFDGKDYPVTAIRIQTRVRLRKLMTTRWS